MLVVVSHTLGIGRSYPKCCTSLIELGYTEMIKDQVIRVGGNVEIRLPADSNAEVQAHVRKGQAKSDFPLEVKGDNQDGHSVSGRIGNGGPRITASIDRGEFHITKKRPQYSQQRGVRGLEREHSF